MKRLFLVAVLLVALAGLTGCMRAITPVTYPQRPLDVARQVARGEATLEDLAEAYGVAGMSASPDAQGGRVCLFDKNGNDRLDDEEILEAIKKWISGEPVDGKPLTDTEILEFIGYWISGEELSCEEGALTEEEAQNILDTLDAASNKYNELRQQLEEFSAASMVVKWLRSLLHVQDVEFTGTAISILFDKGIESILLIQPIESDFSISANSTVFSLSLVPESSPSSTKSAIILLPRLGLEKIFEEPKTIKSTLKDLNYTLYQYDGHQVTVELLNNLDWSFYDFIYINTHGRATRNKIVLLTGEEPTPDKIIKYRNLLINGELAILETLLGLPPESGLAFAVTSSFFGKFKYNGSIVHVDACESLKNETLANAFLNGGAKLFLGWTDLSAGYLVRHVASGLYTLWSQPNATISWAYDKPSISICPPGATRGRCPESKLYSIDELYPATLYKDTNKNKSIRICWATGKCLGDDADTRVDFSTDFVYRGSGATILNPTSALRPSVLISPSSGPAGTQFFVQWEGFTSNSTLTSHLQRPDGTEFPTKKFNTDSQGKASHTIDSTGFSPGTYTLWAVDDATGTKTINTATFTITKGAQLTPKVTVSPSSGSAGTQFDVLWEGFTPNNSLTSHLKKPDGTEFPTKTFYTDGQGRATHTIDSTGFKPGAYELWAIDNATGTRTVNTASFTIITPTTGSIQVNATFDGRPWEGPIEIKLIAPDGRVAYLLVDVPWERSGFTPGAWTLEFRSGGPEGGILKTITPSSTQTLTAGGTITFTLNFVKGGPPDMPDLWVEEIWIFANNLWSCSLPAGAPWKTQECPFSCGDRVKISVMVRNEGMGDAVGIFRTSLYFDGNLIGYYDRNGLAGGRSLGAPYGDFFIWEQDFTWPKDDRSHTIKTIVDVNNTIKESNEANNELSGSFQAKCPLPAKCYPDLPAPKLAVTGTEEYEAGGQQWTRYWMSVTNRSAFPDELFELAPDLPPCGLNKNASRTWVDIYAKDGTRLSGFCALSSSEGLDRIWFAVPRGQLPPDFVYITLWDRRCNITYTSNLAPTRGLPPPCMSRTRFTDSVGRDVAKYIVGDTVYVTVEDCDENRTPGVVDTVKGALTVENPRTKVMVDLVETEPDTGVFLSKPITIGELGSGAMLEVKEGDTLKATYKDPDDPRDVSTDEVYIYVPPPICPPSPCSPFGFGCANPASVYCTSLGYELEIVEEPEGQVGMCIFPDGSKCEEWSFFKGECGQQFSYCERFGGGRIDPTPGYCDFALSECAVCILPDGSRCLDWDYCAGECP